MKMADYYNVSKEMLTDHGSLAEHYKAHFQKVKRRLLQKKSLRIFNPIVELFDQHGDNFMRNLITCRTEFDGYKVPRIIKRLIAK